MAKTKIASKDILEDLTGVVISFADGETVEVKTTDLSDEIFTRLALHGLSQKLGDSYSGEGDITVARTKVEGVVTRLKAGDWKATREGGGGRITALAQALARVTGRTVAEATAVIDGMTKEAKASLRKHSGIKVALADIAAEKAKEAAEKDSGGAEDLAALLQ